MSDTQEKRPEPGADNMEPLADSKETGSSEPKAATASVDEHARMAALDELDAARKQLLAAQEQMDAAQKRLAAIESGMQQPETATHLAPQPLISPTLAKEEPKKPIEKEEEPPAPKDTQPPVTASPSGFMDSLFRTFSKLGPIAILLFLGGMAWPIFFPFDNLTYCPAELAPLTSFLHMTSTGDWFTPTALENGAWALPQWPLYSWCIAVLTLIPGLMESGLLLPIVSFGCVFACVFAVWSLILGTGFGGRAAMASVIILLCAPIFAPMPHFMGPAALTAALMLFAILFFYRGWIVNSSWFCLPLAFIFTTLAGLSGGLLPFITPLATSICFLVWRGRINRSCRIDAVFGIIIMLAMLGCWLGVLIDQGKEPYLRSLFANSWHWDIDLPWKWILPVALGILGLMPWVLMVFGVSWARVIAKSAKSFSASRHENGSTMLWVSIVIAMTLSLFAPGFHPSAIIIACLLACLLGKAFVRLPKVGNCLFFLLASLCLIAGGILMLGMTFHGMQNFMLSHLPNLPIKNVAPHLESLNALRILAIILIIGGLGGFFFVKKFRGAGGLFYGMLLVIFLCQPARLMLVPELAAMPGTPLVPFTTIEAQVAKALAPAAPATPAVSAPPAEAPANAPAPAEESVAPAAESAPSTPEPVLQAPAQQEAAQPAEPPAPADGNTNN